MRYSVPVLALALAVAGCSAPPSEPSPEPTAPVPATTTAARTPSPTPSPTPPPTVPLVLAVHHSRTPPDLTRAAAEGIVGSSDVAEVADETLAVVDGREDPGAAIEQLTQDPGVLAIVPVGAVDERVRVATVDAVDPLLEPDAYPLTVEADEAVEPTITTVTIVGDIMLGRRVGAGIVDDPAAPFRPFAERLSAADVTIGNFESTLSDNGQPIQGGDSFAADPAVLEGLRLAGFDAVSLANNHMGDFGDVAMAESFAIFDDAGIDYFGGGPDLDAARAPWIVEDDGVSVGFIGTESIGEAPGATADSGGTNRLNMPPRTGPLDEEALDRIAGDIAALDEQVDTVIVVPHWGAQYTHAPEPIQHDVAARFAEAGADLVIGGHPHWVQGWEVIGETTVVHSLGNFIFDMDFNREVQEGVFVEIVLWDGEVKAMAPVPYVIDDHIPRPAEPEEAAKILADMRSTSTGPYAAG
ncbi:MAG: CapA family protein [Propionibacterium sp.]|nr:CapA family protein [Propionibacterium sp.]